MTNKFGSISYTILLLVRHNFRVGYDLSGSTPSSSEVLWPSRSNGSLKGGPGSSQVGGGGGGGADGGYRDHVVNSTFFAHNSKSWANYSTALSVTIAIGCSLLVLNVLIFVAVYYQNRSGHRDTDRKLHTPRAASISHFLEQAPAPPPASHHRRMGSGASFNLQSLNADR